MKTRIQIHVKLHETTDPFDSSCIIGFHGVVIVGGGGCARHVRLHNTHYSAVQCTQYPVQSTVGIQHSPAPAPQHRSSVILRLSAQKKKNLQLLLRYC